MKSESMTPDHHHHMHDHYPKCVSWSAIIIGAFVGVGLSFLLNLFSIGIGLAAFTTVNGTTAIAIGGLVGLLIGGIASMFFSGWVAGYLGRPFSFHGYYGALYGFAAWCLALIITVMLTSPFSHFVSTAANFITKPTYIVTETPTTAPAVETKREENVVNAEAAAAAMAKTAFTLFVIFFVGALSSSFGGYCGYHCREKECNKMGESCRP